MENLVRFLSNFDPHFPNIRRARKRCKIYIESIGIYCKNIESIESMEVKTLESNALRFHFAWKGTLRPNNPVPAYDSVGWQKYLILMSWVRNGKNTKVAESKIILGAEFLFATFIFDLVCNVLYCIKVLELNRFTLK